jgi:hypothetical protein
LYRDHDRFGDFGTFLVSAKCFYSLCDYASRSTVLWLLFIKSKPSDAPNLPLQPFTEYLGVAAKSKYVWIGATALFFMISTFVTQSGFLPNALTQGKGIDPVSAGLVASSLTFASIAGMVIVPMVSNKVGLIRPGQIIAPYNYCTVLQDNISSATPILNEKNDVIGALVVVQMLAKRDVQNLQAHSLGWVISMGFAIENLLKVKRRNLSLALTNGILETTLSLVDEGIITLNKEGYINHIN